MKTIFFLVLIAILLAVFNPDMENFMAFVREQSEVIIRQQAGDSALGRALSGAGASLAGDYVDRITERTNYFVFSTYTIDLDGPDEEGGEWEFVGIADQFIETERPESMEQ